MVLGKPWRKSAATKLDIWDGAFCKNIYILKVANDFRKRISSLDAYQNPKYTSRRRMKIEIYISL